MCGRTAISLFGGKSAAVVIDKEGSIILITKNNLKNDDKDVEAKKLYNGIMPVDVAILRDIVYVVDSNGRLYYSRISQGKLNTFSNISELQGELIESVSGKSNHCFAITDDGRVFGSGSNNKCKLGLPSSKTRCDKFTEITSMNEYIIVSAFAGENHSFFKTSTGKILVCGNNSSGQLFLDIKSYIVYPPVELPSCYNNHFFIAGYEHSFAINENEIPPNIPNRRSSTYSLPKLITKNVVNPSSSTGENSIKTKKTPDQEIIKLQEEFAAKEKNYKLQINELEKKLENATQKATKEVEKKRINKYTT